MKLRQAIVLIAVAALTAGCGIMGLEWNEDHPIAVNDPGALDSVPPDTAQPDAQEPNAPDAPQPDAPQPDDETVRLDAFVPMTDDLTIRLNYGDEMDGPGWYRVTIVDPAFPDVPVCNSTIETDSSDGLSSYGADDYTCNASLFNSFGDNRPLTDTYIINITNSHGNEISDGLLYKNGSFVNEVGNVITYDVP